jgi:hypothetical protein
MRGAEGGLGPALTEAGPPLSRYRYASSVKTASTPGKPATWTRGLLRCGQAAGPVFVVAFLLEGARREDYLPLRHPVSSLALGPRGWVQTANFTVNCSWRSWRAGQRAFALYSAGTAITMTATTALASAGFGQAPRFVSSGGLFQRASIITGFAWLTALSARARQHAPDR